MQCPGQDKAFWKPEDIFWIACPQCGKEIEFWKDEPTRVFRHCKKEAYNSQINLSCAKWCKMLINVWEKFKN